MGAMNLCVDVDVDVDVDVRVGLCIVAWILRTCSVMGGKANALTLTLVWRDVADRRKSSITSIIVIDFVRSH